MGGPKNQNNGPKSPSANINMDELAEKVANLVMKKLDPRIKNMVVKIEKLEKLVMDKNETIKGLEDRLCQLEEQIDAQEQYSRRTSIRISGVTETAKENVEDEVMKILTPLKIAVNKTSINRAHRVGLKSGQGRPTDDKPRQIIVQFKDYPSKTLVMRNKRHIDREDFPNIYISEDLTKKRSQLLFRARETKRQKKISECWSYDGRIVIKDLSNNIVNISKEEDLMSF